MFIRAVRRSGRWFPERGCILEPQIFRFADMILRDRCSTSYNLASLFRGRRSTLETWAGKIAKRNGRRPSALHSIFHYWRKSRRIASFLMLPTSKIEEVSQKLLRFWRYLVQKLRKVSQNSFVFKLADRHMIDIDNYNYNYHSTLHYYYNYKCKYTMSHYTTLITLH